jgi:hypothetical protein
VITNPQIGDVFRDMNGNDYEVIVVHEHQVVLKHVVLRLASVYELHAFYRQIESQPEIQMVA